MKKVNFFKVMSAFVAFSAMTLASCTEEKMTITSPTVDIPAFVLPDAKATVSVSVYDVESNTVLGVTSENVTPGTTVTVECPAYEGYIVPQPVEVEIPALVAGQVAVVPVTFYVVSEESAAAEIVEQFKEGKPEEVIPAEAVKYSKVVKNESNKVLHDDFMVEFLEGMQFEGVEVAESRAAATGAEFLEAIFGEVEFTTAEPEKVFEYWLNPWHEATLSAEQKMYTVVYTFEFNGEVYDVTFTAAGAYVKSMSAATVIEEYKHNWEHVLAHGHAGHDYHGHGHGSENAGGGIVEGE